MVVADKLWYFIALSKKMSIRVPIYQRILYGSPEVPHQEEHKQINPSTRPHSLHINQYSNSMKETRQSEMQHSPRQTMSAPLLPSSSVINVQKEYAKNIPRLLSSAPSMPLMKSNAEYQSERWKERERDLSHSRTLKRTSNIIAHRQDKGYYISGSRVALADRYDIDEDELIKLRMLAHSRTEKSTRASSVNSSTFQRKFSPGVSPSGQNSSPVPPSTAGDMDKKSNLGKRNVKEEREKRREMERERQKEKEKRLEEKERFEKEMEEKYKPKKPVQKSMIFVTEHDDEKKGQQRVFLTESDFMEEEEKGAVYSFVNEKQRSAFTSIFDDIDKNKDGHVDIEELKQQLFPLVSKKNLKYLLQVFDLNKDHTIDVREFVTICALNDKLCGIRTESETASLALDLERLAQHITIYKELFQVVDEDGDGRLQSDEVLLMVITALEGEHQLDEEESKRVLDSVEKDEKGFIDFVSFLTYIPFFVKLLKLIMDSPLSISRLEKVRDEVTRKFSRNATHSS